MLDDILSVACVNQSYVVLSGFSNGCMMTHDLMCRKPELWRGGCCGSGCMSLGESKCNKDWNNAKNKMGNMNLGMMEIHGENDDIVPYHGSFWCPSIKSTAEAWTNRMNCDHSTEYVTYKKGNFECKEQYSCNEGRVRQCVNKKGGHDWYHDLNFDNSIACLEFLRLINGDEQKKQVQEKIDSLLLLSVETSFRKLKWLLSYSSFFWGCWGLSCF